MKMNGEERSAEHSFRVRVSMERYFSDERARCYMSVAPQSSVRSLARRLRRAFQLPRPFALLSRGHLLPPPEPLALLEPDDPVEVIPTSTVSEAKEVKMSTSAHEETLESTPEPELSPRSLTTPLRSPVTPPHSDEVDAPAAAASAPAPTPSVPPTAVADLDDMRRVALKLLEEYETVPPRRRRRVRRPRRRPAAAAPAVPAALAAEAMIAAEGETLTTATMDVTNNTATVEDAAAAEEVETRAVAVVSVVRNAAVQRGPRLVRALSEEVEAAAAATPGGEAAPLSVGSVAVPNIVL